jgi:hypothetical protein
MSVETSTGNFQYFAAVSTDNPSTDPLLLMPALAGLRVILLSMNMHDKQ